MVTAPSQQVARAARLVTDQQQARIAAAAGSGAFIATVTAVTAGGAADGNALVTIRYRGSDTSASGYAADYTPAVNDRVVCLPVDAQPIILCRIVGYP